MAAAQQQHQGFQAAEAVVRRLWESHGLPPASGVLGRGSGPVLRQLVGTFTPGDAPVLVAQRAVAADVDARAALLSGGRARAILRRQGRSGKTGDPVIEEVLDALGVWAGGEAGRPYDDADRQAGVQSIAERLARLDALVVRDGPVRVCPSCAAPRSPERTIYHEEIGDTFLVRFPLEPEGDTPPVDALAWVDAPWRVLGATALLVNPDLPYATVEYRRGDVTARLLVLRSSLGRLNSWLSGVELKVLEERPGRAYTGRRYVYPLRHEFPDGGSLAPPSGTVQPVPEVGDSGTGVVPLVPGHGGSDAQIAERLGVQGWPLLTLRGTLDLTLVHKYAGLDLDTATEFVARDLTEAGSVLARLRVLRGVPYCGVCGHPMVWFPGRCWCLEPGRLPAEQVHRYGQILPHGRPISEIEVTPWAASETTAAQGPGSVTLTECERCSRLDAPGAASAPCPCGGRRRPVARRLLPSLEGAFAAWAAQTPIPPGDPVRLYVGARRRAPAIVHQLAGMAGVESAGAEVEATILPTVSDVDLPGLVRDYGADAVRAALVRSTTSEGPAGSFIERCRQERHRLDRLVDLAAEIALASERGATGGPVTASDRELEPEDRALLARWAATEVRVLAAYEELRPGEAHRRIVRFVEVDLAHYRDLVRPREAANAPAASKRAVTRTLAAVVTSVATALAPVAPFAGESIVRTLRPDPRSLFETEPFDVDRPPPDETLSDAWERWLAVVRAAERFRSDRRLPARTTIPLVALVVPDDELGDRLRGDRSLLERLAAIGRLEVGSPRAPWEGRRRQLVPVDSEIQKAYPTSYAQIAHLLRRMPPRRSGDPEASRGFSVFVQGQPHQITPEMLTVVESLPERVVPSPFALGEMYAEVPGAGAAAGPGAPLALSADAAWLVRRIAHRLRRVGREGAGALTVRVVAIDPLARELRERWAAVAATLGVGRLTIDAPSAPDGGAPILTGRTHLGARWTVEIPGLTPASRGPRRRTPRGPPASTRRMPLRRHGVAPSTTNVDFADDQVIHHEDEVRALGEQLDKLLDAPVLGPSKVTLAWEAGYASIEDFSSASFDELVTLPGFGRPVAARLFTKLGRPVPRPAVKPRPVRPPRLSGPPPPILAPASPAAPAAVPAPVGVPEGETLPPEIRDVTVATPPSASASGAEASASTAMPPAPPIALPAPPVVVPAPPPPAPLPPSEQAPPPPPTPPAPPPPWEPAYLPESARPVPPPPTVAPSTPAPSGLEVEVSGSLLPAIQPFLDATAAGHRGLAVVRELPERIRTLVGPRPVAVYWITNLARDRTIRPSDLAGLANLVQQGIEGNAITAVFLEGIEYLTHIHGSSGVLAFLKEVDRTAREHGVRAWLHLTPGLLAANELEQMVRDLGAALPAAEPGPTPEAGS